LDGKDIDAFILDLIARVSNNELIRVLLNSSVTDFSGVRGNFATGVMTAPAMFYQKIEHGIAIVATGAQEDKPREYCYGQDERVVTQLELEGRIAKNSDLAAGIRDVVMIQCVGSRNEQHPSCSRTCCATAIKNALKLKQLNPAIKIHILYRDMRTYGLMEPYYAQARREGVLFVRYEPAESPEVTIIENKISVSFLDKTLKERFNITPDLLVLSSATIPRENKELANLLKVPRTAEGFFLEAHMKLRPVDFASEGLFLCGTAHAPKFVTETISQANAVAGRAAVISLSCAAPLFGQSWLCDPRTMLAL
jgi:heterodisulfide reductase subunit A